MATRPEFLSRLSILAAGAALPGCGGGGSASALPAVAAATPGPSIARAPAAGAPPDFTFTRQADKSIILGMSGSTQTLIFKANTADPAKPALTIAGGPRLIAADWPRVPLGNLRAVQSVGGGSAVDNGDGTSTWTLPKILVNGKKLRLKMPLPLAPWDFLDPAKSPGRTSCTLRGIPPSVVPASAMRAVQDISFTGDPSGNFFGSDGSTWFFDPSIGDFIQTGAPLVDMTGNGLVWQPTWYGGYWAQKLGPCTVAACDPNNPQNNPIFEDISCTIYDAVVLSILTATDIDVAYISALAWSSLISAGFAGVAPVAVAVAIIAGALLTIGVGVSDWIVLSQATKNCGLSQTDNLPGTTGGGSNGGVVSPL